MRDTYSHTIIEPAPHEKYANFFLLFFIFQQSMESMQLIEKDDFDMIGALITSYSLTGENTARKIFSYLDIFPLTKALQVSKTWR